MKYFHKTILLYIIIFFSSSMKAQNLSQDSEGNSNIIVPSTLLNLDISNKVATFDFINFYSKKPLEKFFYGLQLKGKAENGTGIIFSNEKIASNSSMNLLLGYSKNSRIKKGKNSNQANAAQSITNEIKTITDKLEKLRNKHIELVGNIPNIELTKNTLIQLVKNNSSLKKDGFIKTSDLKKSISTLKKEYQQEIFHYYRQNLINSFDNDGDSIKLLINKANIHYTSVLSSFEKIIEISEKLDNKMGELTKLENSNPKMFSINNLFFLRGGINGSSFKYDENKNATTINDRFNNKTFNGWQAEIGYNYNRRLTYFGISASSSYTNNLSGLEETSYTLKLNNGLITDGDFSTTQTIKAFSGEFDSFLRHSINFDYAKLFALNSTDGTYLSFNTYLRHHMYNKSEELKNNMVVGLGLNAINSNKGQLLGGLFLQTNDLFGNNSGKSNTLGKRITFGIVAKIAFKATDLGQ